MNNPIIHIEDNFFNSPEEILEMAWMGDFEDFELGVDGVTYPFIQSNLPVAIEYEFLYKLERSLGERIIPHYLFLRAMPSGVSAPSKIHSDRDMGTFTAHVYLSPSSNLAATSFLRHKDFGYLALPEHEGSWSQDLSDWDKYLSVHGKQNRLFVHQAAHFHCAEPATGFGELKKDARLVLTCFFDVLLKE